MPKERVMSGPQFHEIARALCRSNLPSSAKVVGFCLLDFANNGDNIAWPSLATIAESCHMNRATVVRSVSVLTQCGWIDRIPTARNQSARRAMRLGADLVGAPCASTRRKIKPTVGAPCASNDLLNAPLNDSPPVKFQRKKPTRRCNERIPESVDVVIAYGAEKFQRNAAFCTEFFEYWEGEGWPRKDWRRTFANRVVSQGNRGAIEDDGAGLYPASQQGRNTTDAEDLLIFGRTFP